MRKPNLIIPGFPKSGTSTLHSALVKHDHIFDGGVKEPHTYSWDPRYRKRMSFFKEKYQLDSNRYVLDSSTSYMVSKYAVDRILQDTPNAKFIIIARDPIDRIVSHYNWLSSLNLINKRPVEEIKNHINERFNYRNHYNGNYKSYLDFSLYGEQIEYLLKATDKQNILFLTYENFFSDFENYIGLLENFLDLNLCEITLDKINETSFSKKIIKTRAPLEKRIISRLRFEYNSLKGLPVGLKVKSPIKYKTSREDIEELLFPYLKSDLILLENLGYKLSSWPTYLKLKI